MRPSFPLPARVRPRRAGAVAVLALIGTLASMLAAVTAGSAEPAPAERATRWKAASVTEVEPVGIAGHPTDVLDVDALPASTVTSTVTSPVETAQRAQPAPPARPAPTPPPPPHPRVFAAFEDVALVEPSTEALAIGFHQAGGAHPPLTPVGRSQGNDNPDGTAPADVPHGPEYRVLPSRGRGGPATSAADVALAEGTPVQSVVTGTVTAVNAYTLYGRLTDFLIEIEPDGRPDLRVMVLHVAEPAVAPGDRVEAGRTRIAAGARVLPVGNQIDRYAASCPCPHVDVRVRRV